MNILSSINTLNLLGLATIVGGLVGCATPKPYEPLQILKSEYETISQDDTKRTSAAVTLYEVERLIKKAEAAEEEKDDELLEYNTYLGQKKLEIALAKVEQKKYEAQSKILSEQRNSLLIEARTAEAEDAKSLLEAYKSKETSRGTILVLDDLLFDTGGANLHLGSQKNLEPLIHYLQENTQRNVSIGGHTDSVGTDAYNQALSQRRADAVRDYLIRSGIDEGRIMTRGYGEIYPVASNNTREGRQLNRRVEILIKN